MSQFILTWRIRIVWFEDIFAKWGEGRSALSAEKYEASGLDGRKICMKSSGFRFFASSSSVICCIR